MTPVMSAMISERVDSLDLVRRSDTDDRPCIGQGLLWEAAETVRKRVLSPGRPWVGSWRYQAPAQTERSGRELVDPAAQAETVRVADRRTAGTPTLQSRATTAPGLDHPRASDGTLGSGTRPPVKMITLTGPKSGLVGCTVTDKE